MNYIYNAPFSLPTGWLCPRCNRVNSPSLLVCACKPTITTDSTTGTYTDSSTAVWDELSDEALVSFESGLETAVGETP